MDLYKDLMGSAAQPSQQQPPQDFFGRLAEFSKTFSGDPKQQVMSLMQQRGISQEQFNIAAQQANRVYSMLRGK